MQEVAVRQMFFLSAVSHHRREALNHDTEQAGLSVTADNVGTNDGGREGRARLIELWSVIACRDLYDDIGILR